ncbi:MAG: flagellar motor protein MotD [Steroidobacteraceae bacterium]
MSRRHKRRHEEHANHEAWAIPYADLITLLLAFFVVMYAISTVNEGKYRVLSDSLVAAFRGSPRSEEPIQVGEKQDNVSADSKTTLFEQPTLEGQRRSLLTPVSLKPTVSKVPMQPMRSGQFVVEDARAAAASKVLETVADRVVRAMDQLVRANLVFVRRKASLVEVEIRTDILFPSGSATLSPSAVPVIERLGEILKPFPNPIRVEGHTDNRPIDTVAFPSNWELSAARAASVVRRFAKAGIAPTRLSVIGDGEYDPLQSNATAQGRNANRRVVVVILSTDGSVPDSVEPITVPPSGTPAAAAPPAATPPAAAAAAAPASTGGG